MLLVIFPQRKVIGYTKWHPIYFVLFEEYNWPDFVFFYFNPSGSNSLIEKRLIRKSCLIHLDAANSKEFLNLYSKPVVIECEGKPYNWFFLDSRILKVFVESIWAGNHYLREDKVDLLYPGVFMQVEQDRNIDKNELVLCAIGHGGMIKGYDVVYRVYSELKKRHKIKLIIGGSFGHNYEYYPEISEAAYNSYSFSAIAKELRKDPDVVFKPFKRNELFEEVYPSADIYLHLSRLETFGFSILEAMSHGLPVIATKLHAIPEMVSHGENGYLIDAFEFDINSIEWHNKVFELAINYAENLIQNKHIRTSFARKSYERSRLFSLENKHRILHEFYVQHCSS